MMWIMKASRAVFLSPTPSVVVKSDCGCCHLFLFSSPRPLHGLQRDRQKRIVCALSSELARGDALGWVQVFRPGLQTSAQEFFGAAQLYPRPPREGEFLQTLLLLHTALFPLLCRDKISLCSPGWPGTPPEG